MMGPRHLIAGALAGATYATLQSEPIAVVVWSALAATAASNGPMSPDVDQTDAWRALPNIAGLGNHRTGLSHWWALPVAAWWLLDRVPDQFHAFAAAALIGWTSHLLGDVVFGKLALHPFRGAPTVGLGLRTGKGLEPRLGWVFGAALVWVLAGTPLPGTVGAPEVSAAVPTPGGPA